MSDNLILRDFTNAIGRRTIVEEFINYDGEKSQITRCEYGKEHPMYTKLGVE